MDSTAGSKFLFYRACLPETASHFSGRTGVSARHSAAASARAFAADRAPPKNAAPKPPGFKMPPPVLHFRNCQIEMTRRARTRLLRSGKSVYCNLGLCEIAHRLCIRQAPISRAACIDAARTSIFGTPDMRKLPTSGSIIVALAACAFAGQAHAADLASYKGAPGYPASTPSWAGFYAGVNAGAADNNGRTNYAYSYAPGNGSGNFSDLFGSYSDNVNGYGAAGPANVPGMNAVQSAEYWGSSRLPLARTTMLVSPAAGRSGTMCRAVPSCMAPRPILIG